MDFHERMAIVHADHVFWNPISEEGVADLLESMSLAPGARVLDIACGAGELLVRLAERTPISGVGVDISAAALETARRKAASRVAEAELSFVQIDGARYRPPDDERYDAVCLVGASWIWKGYGGTLDALVPWIRPGGLLLFGEPYWRRPPDPAYCEADGGFTPTSFTTLDGIRRAAADRGLRLITMVGSTDREWDRYEMLQSRAADRWALAHPDHPDREELLAATDRDRHLYLRWGRDLLGFATFLFRAGDGAPRGR